MLFRCLVFVATAAGILAAADSKDIHKTFALDSHGRVTIDTYKGSIRVSTWDRNEADISVRIEEDGDVFAQDVRRADVRFDASASDVRITSKSQLSFFLVDGIAPLYHYTVRMPRTAGLRIKDYKSESDISDLAADLQVDTYKGSLQLRNFSGGLTVNTYKGDIRADFAAITARSSIDTYKGNIDLRMPRESHFDLHTNLGRHANLDSDFARYIPASSLHDGPELRLKSYKGEFRLRAR
jgi:Putative adhesin